MMIQFWAQGVPKGQPRPRAFSRGGHAAVYDPGTAEGWKSCIAQAARDHLPREPLSGPLELTIDLHMPRPKSHKNNKGVVKGSSPVFHSGKPDADNHAKAVMDCLTTIRMWEDDAQVVVLTVIKGYERGNGPGAYITVKRQDERLVEKEVV